MATYATTVKHALRALLGGNVISDIDAGFLALAEDIDDKLSPVTAGLRASRPVSTPGSPGVLGRCYRSTDDGGVDLDTGTAWATIKPGLFAVLPVTPDTNQDILFQTAGMLTPGAGVRPAGPWRCRHDATLSGTSKWKVLDGEPLIARREGWQASIDTTTSLALELLADSPSLTSPVAGLYNTSHGAHITVSGGPCAAGQDVRYTTAAAFAGNPAGLSASSGGGKVSTHHVYAGGDPDLVLGAGEVLTLWGQVTGGFTATFYSQWIELKPRRIG